VFEESFASERAKLLLSEGAHLQRPLWASTGVKDPSLPDTLYVTELVAPQTVNTMPEGTLNAVADHGEITGNTVTDGYHDANILLDELDALGVSYTEVVELLEVEGVDKFKVAWSELQQTVTDQLAQHK
jgi:transaldolase